MRPLRSGFQATPACVLQLAGLPLVGQFVILSWQGSVAAAIFITYVSFCMMGSLLVTLLTAWWFARRVRSCIGRSPPAERYSTMGFAALVMLASLLTMSLVHLAPQVGGSNPVWMAALGSYLIVTILVPLGWLAYGIHRLRRILRRPGA